MGYWINHTVVEMDESLIQRCVKCRKVIADYNGISKVSMRIDSSGVSNFENSFTGFPAGEVFNMGNATMSVRPENDIIDCLDMF